MKWKLVYLALIAVAIIGAVSDPTTHLASFQGITSSFVRRAAWPVGCLLIGMFIEMFAEVATQSKMRLTGVGYRGPSVESLVRAALVYGLFAVYFILCSLDFVWLRDMLPITNDSSTRFFVIGVIVGAIAVLAMLLSLMFGSKVSRDPR